ncbi:MAG: pentapeptide repeat-containing protein, partial [Deltaproteobacteria bacterium]|nr:pentapeptide repeat-containing protein [Deltaproteobacteria bacterium]
MSPNNFSGETPEGPHVPKSWRGVTPTSEELTAIIRDHAAWVNDGFQGDPPHDLKGVIIGHYSCGGADFRRANLRNSDFSRTILTCANFQGADLGGCSFSGVDLSGANFLEVSMVDARFQSTNLHRSRFNGADLQHTTFFSSRLTGTFFNDANLLKSKFTKCKLSGAFFNNAKMPYAVIKTSICERTNFNGTILAYSKIISCDLDKNDFRRSNLQGAIIRNSDITSPTYNRKITFIGINLAECSGSQLFKSFARHQSFLEELRTASKVKKILFYIWNIFADCGRTPWYWIGWSSGFCLLFGYLYFHMVGASGFRGLECLNFTFWRMIYLRLLHKDAQVLQIALLVLG